MKSKLTHFLFGLAVAAIVTNGALISNAQAGQPHMDNALHSLQVARHQLEMARPDKGGHRENAIRIIDNAIAEVRAGMDAAE